MSCSAGACLIGGSRGRPRSLGLGLRTPEAWRVAPVCAGRLWRFMFGAAVYFEGVACVAHGSRWVSDLRRGGGGGGYAAVWHERDPRGGGTLTRCATGDVRVLPRVCVFACGFSKILAQPCLSFGFARKRPHQGHRSYQSRGIGGPEEGRGSSSRGSGATCSTRWRSGGEEPRQEPAAVATRRPAGAAKESGCQTAGGAEHERTTTKPPKESAPMGVRQRRPGNRQLHGVRHRRRPYRRLSRSCRASFGTSEQRSWICARRSTGRTRRGLFGPHRHVPTSDV